MNSVSPLSTVNDNEISEPLIPFSPRDGGAFYAVHLPFEDGITTRSFISGNKDEVFKIAKKYKRARFKAFYSLQEAEQFAEFGPSVSMTISSPQAIEKGSPFRAPKPAEVIQFRRAIERNDLAEVKGTILSNPRYLVGSGDTPAILQDGFRFNCLHIAAKSNRAEIADFVLSCLSSVEFIQMLYGDDDGHESLKNRSYMLVDLYLNTPDKIVNETPLHMASKYGSIDVIKVFVSYPHCDKSRLNKKGLSALDIVGNDNKELSEDGRNEITRLLSSNYFVAVLRSPDLSVEPILADPFVMSSPPSGKRGVHPDLEIRAIAGPMLKDDAVQLKKLWKKPMLSPQSPASSTKYSSLLDPEKRLECIGRTLSEERKIPWSEYWPFLKSFANLKTVSGLRMLERYLEQRYQGKHPCGGVHSWSGTSQHSLSSESDYSSPLPNNLNEESPVTQLCSIFEKLCLSTDSHTSSNTTDLLYICIERTVQLYANKLASCLKSASFSVFYDRLQRTNHLIRSCVCDSRYNGIRFNRIHSRLTTMISRLIQEDRDTVCNFLKKYFLSGEIENLNVDGYMKCLCIGLVYKLSSNFGIGSNGNSSEIPPEALWDAEEECLCFMSIDRRRTRAKSKRQLDFRGDRNCGNYQTGLDSNENKLLDDSAGGYCSDVSDDGSDSSEDSFHTAPSSVTSPLNLSQEDLFVVAAEGEPVFISGSEPRRIDSAVYDAIDISMVTSSEFPYTYLWMLSFRQEYTNITSFLSPYNCEHSSFKLI